VHNKSPLIAHVIYRLDVGGLENGLVNIINGLPEGQYRHVIICLADFTDFHKKIKPDVELIALHKKPGNDLGMYWRLFKIFRRLRPDILHTRNLAALEAQLPAWLAGVKHRVHGLHGWDTSADNAVNSRHLKLYKLMDYLVQLYVPLSDELERFLIDQVSVKHPKSHKICNGVDTERFRPSAFPASTILPEGFLPAGGVLIGTVGRLETVKNQLLLVEGFANLITSFPEFKQRARLVLVGDGSMRSAIEQRVNEAGIEELVWMTGSRNDVPELMTVMDVFVLPSKAEGISNTILEAMATGLPVIATDVGGNAQLVVDAETGFIIQSDSVPELTDRLMKYLDDDALLKKHALAGRQRAEQAFSLQHMVNEYQSVYDGLLVN